MVVALRSLQTCCNLQLSSCSAAWLQKGDYNVFGTIGSSRRQRQHPCRIRQGPTQGEMLQDGDLCSTAQSLAAPRIVSVNFYTSDSSRRSPHSTKEHLAAKENAFPACARMSKRNREAAHNPLIHLVVSDNEDPSGPRDEVPRIGPQNLANPPSIRASSCNRRARSCRTGQQLRPMRCISSIRFRGCIMLHVPFFPMSQ